MTDGVVVAEERHSGRISNDITAHPEIKLARWAAQKLDRDRAQRTTMYTSCEPCQMCSAAIARSHLGRVVFARSLAQLRELSPHPPTPNIIRKGPALFDEARVPIEAYGN